MFKKKPLFFQTSLSYLFHPLFGYVHIGVYVVVYYRWNGLIQILIIIIL